MESDEKLISKFSNLETVIMSKANTLKNFKPMKSYSGTKHYKNKKKKKKGNQWVVNLGGFFY